MLEVLKSLEELLDARATCDTDDGLALYKIALVPTMGALHDGHISLIKRAKELGQVCFVSIFVNPLQFGPNEDFNNYPKSLEEDIAKCKELGVDYVFVPKESDIYPAGRENTKIVKGDDDLSHRLCGRSRVDHFDGVCTVVKRLFELVRPHIGVFGEKDYQQLLIIKAMVKEYDMDIEIVNCPTIREASGLAMSSRNKYLSESERELASNIYKELKIIRVEIKNASDLEARKNYLGFAKHQLESLGIQIEYLEEFKSRIFVAAKIGKARLIDNIAL